MLALADFFKPEQTQKAAQVHIESQESSSKRDPVGERK